MRKLLLVTASVAGLGLAMSAAQAADIIAPAPPEFSWTGFHIGVGGGAGWNTYDAQAVFCDNGSADADCEGIEDEDWDIAVGVDGDDLGSFYGLLTLDAGFDYDFGGFVVGIMGNYDFNGDNDATATAAEVEDDGDFATVNVRAELDDTWFLGGRLGFTVGGLTGGPNTSLIYVLGGYTWANGSVKSQAEIDAGISGTGDVDEDDSVDGWTLGGGIETMLWEAVSLRVEYRHDFLDDIKFDDCGTNGGNCEDHNGEVDFERDTVRGVLSWRFGSWW